MRSAWVKALVSAVAAAVLAMSTTGCARDVDIQTAGAQAVPGVNSLYRFCDGPVLIYFTKISGSSDEFDWYWPGGCEFTDGRWQFANRPPTGPIPNGDSTDGDR